MMRILEESGGTICTSRCQDCGNQAKRECSHLRCRTCCRSQGFQCPTHVKSTWVPASRRRPRHATMHHQPQQITATTSVDQQQQQQQYYRMYGPNPKRHCSRQTLVGSDEGDFPSEVSHPAVFRCVRVTSLDNTIDQYAYQTSMSIGGRVFIGILYDQGPEPERTGNCVAGESSSAGIGLSLLQHPNFATGGNAANATGTTSSSYPRPFHAFTTDHNSQFFQHSKS